MAEENEFTINVNGADHKLSDLPKEDQLLVAQLQDLETQLSQLGFRSDQLNASKQFFSDKLVESLSKKSDADDAQAKDSSESAKDSSESAKDSSE